MIGPGFAAAAFAQSARAVALLIVLALALAFGAGFAFDRWLHRPITAGGMTLKFVANSGTQTPLPKPIPDCMINCIPTDEAGDGPDADSETQASCYGDGSIPCPGARRQRPYGDCKATVCSPEEQECWWAMGDDYCQKET